MSSKRAAQGQHFLISGRVQGVGFRRFVQAEARKLELIGWVRNLTDGRVEAFVEEAASLRKFVEVIERGPGGLAYVENLEIRPSSDMIIDGEFSILATGSQV